MENRGLVRALWWVGVLLAGALVLVASLSLGLGPQWLALLFALVGVGAVVAALVINTMWLRAFCGQISALYPILEEEKDPDRYIQCLNELLADKRSAFLRGIRSINLCAALCQKGDWAAAKEALLEISWRRLHGLQRALYLANLAYVCFYLKEDREALEAMRHNKAAMQKYRMQLGALADVLAIFEAAAKGEKKTAVRLLAEARQDYQDEEICKDLDELERRLGAAQAKEQ